MTKQKTLCKFKKSEIDNHFKEIAKITRSSRYLCKKCARSADAKSWLCKPELI